MRRYLATPEDSQARPDPHTHTHMPSLREKHFRETFVHFARASLADRAARDRVTCRAAVDVQSEALLFDGESAVPARPSARPRFLAV